MANSEFLYKPRSEKNGNLAILLPSDLESDSQVQILDANGNVIDTGSFSSRSNGDRPTYRFQKPGASYGQNLKVQITRPDGSTTQVPIEQGGSVYTSQEINGSTTSQSSPNTATYEDMTYVVPRVADASGIQSAYVDPMLAYDFATGVGAQTRESYLSNLTGADTRGAAMSLVDADIEGIQRATSALGPTIREQGRQDLSVNMQRAGELDRFNMSRLSGINEANRAQADAANIANIATHDRAVQSSGLRYRDRITETLNTLQTMAKGQLSGDMDAQLTKDVRNRGADFASAAGISAISGAGVRAQDRLNIQERLAIQQNALNQLPGVLTTAQSILQAPEQMAPTQYTQPTQVPLPVSNVAGQIPATSAISAGSALSGIASSATQMSNIMAPTAFSTSIATQQFNEQSRLSTDIMKLNNQQQMMSAEDQALQGAINAQINRDAEDRAVERYEKAEEKRERNEWIQAGTDIITQWTGVGQQPNTGAQNPVNTGTATSGRSREDAILDQPGVMDERGAFDPPQQSPGAKIAGNVGEVIQSGIDYIPDLWLGKDSSASSSTDTSDSSNMTLKSLPAGATRRGANNIIREAKADILGDPMVLSSMYAPKQKTPVQKVTSKDDGLIYVMGPRGEDIDITSPDAEVETTDGRKVVGGYNNKDGTYSLFLNDGKEVKSDDVRLIANFDTPSIVEQVNDHFDTAKQTLNDAGVDGRVVSQSAKTIQNWNTTPTERKIADASNIGATVLENRGIIDKQTSRNVSDVSNTLAIVADPRASDAQKTQAIAQTSARFMTNQYTGSLQNPDTINGNMVISSVAMPDGSAGFEVIDSDGNISSVSQASLVTSNNIQNGLNTYAVLVSDADDDTKIRAMTSIGISAAQANGILDDVKANGAMGALNLFNTAVEWGDASDFQRAMSVVKSSSGVMNSIGSLLPDLSTNAGFATLNTALSTAGSLVAIGAGIYTAAETIDALKDIPKSQGQVKGITSLGLSGASIGVGIGGLMGAALPFGLAGLAVGLIGGVIATETGTGKGSGQVARDGWRKGLEELGIAKKIDGSHHVTLADGTTYDIGKDGGHKLTNGTERYTFDVDWDNEAAVGSIPSAHLFAMATGLDPTTDEGKDLFHRTTAQILNAATSNTDSVEGTQANMRSMLENAGYSAKDVALRLETLRAQNLINEQEYGVYIKHMNEMFNTKMLPTDKEKATQFIVSSLEAQAQKDDSYRPMLESITNQSKIASNTRARTKRIQSDSKKSTRYQEVSYA